MNAAPNTPARAGGSELVFWRELPVKPGHHAVHRFPVCHARWRRSTFVLAADDEAHTAQREADLAVE